jgi:hypothetical protein
VVNDADDAGVGVGVESSLSAGVEEPPVVGVEVASFACAGVELSAVGAGVETSPTGAESPSSRSTEQPESIARTRTATTSSGRERIGA